MFVLQTLRKRIMKERRGLGQVSLDCLTKVRLSKERANCERGKLQRAGEILRKNEPSGSASNQLILLIDHN